MLVSIRVNLRATWKLMKPNRKNKAVQGSFRHILTRLYAFIGTVIAGIVILAAAVQALRRLRSRRKVSVTAASMAPLSMSPAVIPGRPCSDRLVSIE